MKPFIFILLIVLLANTSFSKQDPQKEETSNKNIFPIFMFTTDTGLGLGVFFHQTQKTKHDRPSSFRAFLLQTTKSQSIFSISPNWFSEDSKYEYLINYSYRDWRSDFFGVDSESEPESTEDYRLIAHSIQLEGTRKVSSDSSLGLAIQHNSSLIKEFKDLGYFANLNKEARNTEKSSIYFIYRKDSRDFPRYPNQGFLLESKLGFHTYKSKSFNGYRSLNIEARKFLSITNFTNWASKLSYSENSSDDVYYLDQLSLGGDRFLRGFSPRRFLGTKRILFHNELRHNFTDKWVGMVFRDSGIVSKRSEDLLSEKWRDAYGLGGAYILNTDDRTTVRLNYAKSKDEKAVYFVFDMAF